MSQALISKYFLPSARGTTLACDLSYCSTIANESPIATSEVNIIYEKLVNDLGSHIPSELKEFKELTDEAISGMSIARDISAENLVSSPVNFSRIVLNDIPQNLYTDSEELDFKLSVAQLDCTKCEDSLEHGVVADYFISSAESNAPGEDRVCVKYIGNSLKGFAVYDGHGGNLACEIAQSYLLDDLLTSISKLSIDQRAVKDTIIENIIKVYEECDRMILSQAQSIVDRRNSRDTVTADQMTCWDGKNHFCVVGKRPERAGSCAVVAIIVDFHLYISHIGDSRAILIRKSANFKGNSLDYVIDEDCFQFADTFEDKSSTSEELFSDSVKQSNDFETKKTNNLSGRKRKNSKSQHSSATSILSTDIEKNDYFFKSPLGFEIINLTADHSCEVEVERSHILKLSKDPFPFRPSRGDVSILGDRAPNRVAGSLSVTRAFGNGYLKRTELSGYPFAEYVPYITPLPVICERNICDNDIGIILASDGFWNNITAKEIAAVMQPYIEGNYGDSSQMSRANFHRGSNTVNAFNRNTSASALLEKCLENAAKAACIPLSRMKKMPPGTARRNIVDDITILVIIFSGRQ